MAHVLGSLCSPDCLLIIVCSATKVNRFAQILRNCLFADRLCSALSSCVFFHAPPLLLHLSSFYRLPAAVARFFSPQVFPLPRSATFFLCCLRAVVARCRSSRVFCGLIWSARCLVWTAVRRLGLAVPSFFLSFPFLSPLLSRLGFADCRRSHFFFARFACSLFHALISSRRVLNLPSTPSSVGW